MRKFWVVNRGDTVAHAVWAKSADEITTSRTVRVVPAG